MTESNDAIKKRIEYCFLFLDKLLIADTHDKRMHYCELVRSTLENISDILENPEALQEQE